MAERISFTRPSAERIARAVRAVENTRLDGQALSFRRQMLEGVRGPIKLATFQGPWPRDSVNTIMFKGTDRTADAANLFFPVPGTQTRECAVAKIGTAWHLIDVPFYERTAVFASGTASRTFFGTGSTSTIRFIGTGSTSQLSFISSVSTASGTISFLRGVSASLNTANCTITVTPDQGTATFVASISPTTGTAISVSMSGTQTAISVSMSGTQAFTMITNTFTASFLSFEVT